MHFKFLRPSHFLAVFASTIMSAFVKKKVNNLMGSNTGENVMEHSMEVLFLGKYYGLPGDTLMYTDSNCRYNGVIRDFMDMAIAVWEEC